MVGDRLTCTRLNRDEADRDLRFALRRAIRDEALARAQEEAGGSVQHGAEGAGDLREEGGLLGIARGMLGSRGRVLCLRARGESYLIRCEPPGLQSAPDPENLR